LNVGPGSMYVVVYHFTLYFYSFHIPYPLQFFCLYFIFHFFVFGVLHCWSVVGTDKGCFFPSLTSSSYPYFACYSFN
jgi:hypothetical protein